MSTATIPASRVSRLGALVREERRHTFMPGASDAVVLGNLLAAYLGYSGVAVLRTAEAALAVSGFSVQVAEVKAIADVLDTPDPDARIDRDTRSALFARLTEVYGKALTNDRHARLAKLNLLAGRPADDPITSLSDIRGDMLNRDARRVFDMLDEIAAH
jgi:hypothetical protein